MGHYAKYKIAILGFGIEGQDAARYFLGQGSDITVFDKKPKDQILTSEWQDKPIKWVCGQGYLKNGLVGFDYIVRSPGLYRNLAEIVEAEKKGAKITSNTILFFEESEANIIGITGTKGKGTAARMLQKSLEECGKKILLLGNIGTPMLDRIPDADTFDWVILELSSFQLIDLPYSPPVAVVTNIATDHLNWHKDRDEYIHAKKNLWKYQKKDNFVIFNYDDETCREFAKIAHGQVLWFSTKTKVDKGAWVESGKVFAQLNEVVEVGRTSDLSISGEHNVANSLAALVAATSAGCDPRKAWEGIGKFTGAEHRLEKVAEINGVTYINDSAATTPEAGVAALRSFPQPKILIAGGSLKGITFENFVKEIKENNVKAVLLLGEGGELIDKELRIIRYQGLVRRGFTNMGAVVEAAKEIATAGDVVLLSPGCASFGMFANYQERGKKFKEAVLEMR